MLLRAARPLPVRPSIALASSSRLTLASRPVTVHSRNFFSLFGKKKPEAKANEPVPNLAQNNLFHPLSQSPFDDLRARGKRIEEYAICPVSYEKYHETLPVRFECPDCGFPTHATEERWREGKKEHEEFCSRLREVNEDEHDLRSGRRLTEFENLPGE